MKQWSQSFNVFNLNQTEVEKVEFCSLNIFVVLKQQKISEDADSTEQWKITVYILYQ